MNKSLPQKAFIFAAGLGTRMMPLTENTPKPLIKVCGKALLDYSIDMIIEAGINQIGINTFYLAEQVEGHIQKYLERGIDIKIFRESERLETGGGLMNAMSFIDYQPIITLNSDVIFRYKTNPVKRLLKNWDAEKSDLLMLLSEKERSIGFYDEGNFDLDSSGFVNTNDKKPYIYSGLQIINTDILRKYHNEKIFSLSKIFIEKSAQKRISALIHDDFWLHVGDLNGLSDAEKFLLK